MKGTNSVKNSNALKIILKGVKMSMHIYIVDDDVLFSKQLEKDVDKFFSKIDSDLTIDIFNEKFSTIFDLKNIDIMFLDINLEEKFNGIYFASYIKKIFPNMLLVFISSNNEFVFPALSIGFFQFIRKTKYKYDIPIVFQQLKEHLFGNCRKVVIRENGYQYAIKISDIEYILSIGHDLIVKTTEREFVLINSLSNFLKECVDNKELVQIARNLAINLQFTKKVTKTKVVMMNENEFSIGRKYQRNFIESYEEYLLR